jgi:hypothetical protein
MSKPKLVRVGDPAIEHAAKEMARAVIDTVASVDSLESMLAETPRATSFVRCRTCRHGGGRTVEQLTRWLAEAREKKINISAPRLYELITAWCQRNGISEPLPKFHTFYNHLHSCDVEVWRAVKAAE